MNSNIHYAGGPKGMAVRGLDNICQVQRHPGAPSGSNVTVMGLLFW